MGRNGCGQEHAAEDPLRHLPRRTAVSVRVRAPMTPILELGVGWNPELDAIDNIFLIGAVMGLSLGGDPRVAWTRSSRSPSSSASRIWS